MEYDFHIIHVFIIAAVFVAGVIVGENNNGGGMNGT